MTRNEQVERLRAHLEKRRDHAQIFVSVDGLRALFEQRDQLKALVESMIATKGKRIEGMLLRKDANGDVIPWPESADYFMAFDPDNPDIPTD